MPLLYFSVFNLILSCIHCSSFSKNPNVCNFIDFIPKAIYVVYFLNNTCMWSFEISVLHNCGHFPFYSFKQPNDGCIGWNMFLTDTYIKLLCWDWIYCNSEHTDGCLWQQTAHKQNKTNKTYQQLVQCNMAANVFIATIQKQIWTTVIKFLYQCKTISSM